jgi:hypothetical protein
MTLLKFLIYFFPSLFIMLGYFLYNLYTMQFEIIGIRLIVSGVLVYLVEVIVTLITFVKRKTLSS